MSSELQVVIASGPDDPKRVVLGLSMAASAVAAGAYVRLYFVMDGAQWLREEHCSTVAVPGYPPLAELMEAVRMGGGDVEFCPHCVENRCAHVATSSAQEGGCGCASSAGMAAYGVRMPTTPTVVF